MTPAVVPYLSAVLIRLPIPAGCPGAGTWSNFALSLAKSPFILAWPSGVLENASVFITVIVSCHWVRSFRHSLQFLRCANNSSLVMSIFWPAAKSVMACSYFLHPVIGGLFLALVEFLFGIILSSLSRC